MRLVCDSLDSVVCRSHGDTLMWLDLKRRINYSERIGAISRCLRPAFLVQAPQSRKGELGLTPSSLTDFGSKCRHKLSRQLWIEPFHSAALLPLLGISCSYLNTPVPSA
jgi:hypothetical protein